ncbi:MAG: CPn0927/CPn0928 family alpha/beta hydrolase fold protein [Candidatus Rhabdochlamydia sp.]
MSFCSTSYHNNPLEIVYPENKIVRLAKQLFPLILLSVGVCYYLGALNASNKMIRLARKMILPSFISVGIYPYLHAFVGKQIIPASSSPSLSISEIEPGFNLKKLIIKMDGHQIDGCIVTKTSSKKDRWLLYSQGRYGTYEREIECFSSNFKKLLNGLDANGIIFNYPRTHNKKTVVKSYQAMLSFLEDKEKGMGAKEIIGHGFSLGGGIQGEALKTHPLKKDVKYVFIKDRTFSSLSQLVSLIMGRILGLSVKCLGWDMDSATSSKTLKVPEIILQKTKKENFHELENVHDLSKVDYIHKKGSLAFELLQGGFQKNKHFLGITSFHDSSLDKTTIKHLSEIVNQAFIEDMKS